MDHMFRQHATMPGGYDVTVHGTPGPDGHLLHPELLEQLLHRVHRRVGPALDARPWTPCQALALVADHLSLALLDHPHLDTLDLEYERHGMVVDLRAV